MAYKDSRDAQQGLTAAFTPTNDTQREAIAQAAALVPSTSPSSTPPSPTPIRRTVDPQAQAAEDYLGTFQTPKSQADIAEGLRRQNQGLIDSINKTFDDEVARRTVIGDERLEQNNAISVMAGLMGSTEAVRTRNTVQDANEKEIQAVNNQRQLALAQVYTQISQDAREEARQQLEDATRSAEQVLARREAKQTKAMENLTLLAAGGIDFDKFRTDPNNQQVYQYALDAVDGNEAVLKKVWNDAIPQDQILKREFIGSKMYTVYENPLKPGEVKTIVSDTGFDMPTDWKTADLGNRIMFYDPRDPTRQMFYGKGLTPSQQGEPEDASNASGLVQQALDAIATLETLDGKEGAVGAKGPSSLFGLKDTPLAGTAAAGYVAQLDRVKALLTLPNLQYLKGLGAMSDREFSTISASVAALNRDMSEEQFDAELARIKEALQSTGSTMSTPASVGSDLDTLAASKGLSADELQDALAQYGEEATREFLNQ